MMQPRFEKRVGATPFSLVEQPRFRAGFDFLRLRADVQEVDETLADWWQEFSMASDQERQDLLDAARAEQQSRARTAPGRMKRAPAPVAPSAPTAAEATATAPRLDESDGQEESSDAPRKRRRRRRSGAAKAAAAAGNAGGAATPGRDEAAD